jgi:peptide/nickel transport system permease protein
VLFNYVRERADPVLFAYIVRRLLATLPVLLLTSMIVFLLMHLLPGDPIIVLVGQAQSEVSAQTLARLRHEYGLDLPVWGQYVAWLAQCLSGNLGRSIQNNQTVWQVIAPRILPTAQIGVTAWLLAVVIAIPVGAFTSRIPGSWQDWLATITSLAGAAMPYFLTGGVLIYVVALRWRLLPASGYTPLTERPLASLASTLMPAVTLSLGLAAVLARQSRASFAEVLRLPYIRTARAKGLTERRVVGRHAAYNALLPIVTVLGLQLGTLFSGAVVTETVFAIPGIGRLLVDAILGRDYPVVQGVVLLITIAVIVSNLLVDILYGLLDPRLRGA